jgi:hypothetical protein
MKMKSKLHILQHSLGLDQYGAGRQYRNHFVTGPGGKDYEDCCSLVEMGSMKNHGTSAISGGSDCFTVTPAGIDYVALNSPTRPPAPKLTRSQKRYQEYRNSDCGLTYAEYLGIATRCKTDYATGMYVYTNGKMYEWERITGPPAKTIKEAKAGYKAVLTARVAA